MRRLVAQFARFGVVGAVGLVVDLTLFNVLLLTVFSPERIHEGPVLAKVCSTAVAIVCNWVGNRSWTFREHRGARVVREGLQFAAVSVGGMLIAVGCLWVSHYLLGFTSVLADNIASNAVGLALGTAFRFLLYRSWVFRDRSSALDRTWVFSDRPSRRRSRLSPSATAPPAAWSPRDSSSTP